MLVTFIVVLQRAHRQNARDVVAGQDLIALLAVVCVRYVERVTFYNDTMAPISLRAYGHQPRCIGIVVPIHGTRGRSCCSLPCVTRTM